jgi:hypothetical protein
MNTISLNSISLDGNIIRKGGTPNSWVGNTKEISLPYTDAKLWESCSYYNSFESAMSDIGAGQVASNCNEADAVVAVDKARFYRLWLLKDIQTSSIINLDNIELILNGHKLSVDTPMQVSADCVINGRSKGSTIIGKTLLVQSSGLCSIVGGTYQMNTSNMGVEGSPYPTIQVDGGNLVIESATLVAVDDNGGTISNVLVNTGAALSAKDSYFKLTSKYGMQSCCVFTKGVVTLERCKLEAFSDHTANSAGTNYARTARAIYGETTSVTSLFDCYVYGAHSGMTYKGDLTIDGGTYCGYSHGGVYLSNSNKTNKIKNATFKEVPLPSEYYDDGVAGTNLAGMYVGGASGIQVYVDNCTFSAQAQPIVLKTGGNTLYISNSRMNKNYTRAGIRNDSSNQVKFGVNNNFNYTNLENKRNYEDTGLDYGIQ